MKSYPYSEFINLHVPGRISQDDGLRQMRTAKEILNRLETQPGLVLADEVGMGKTFVALAVAASVSMADKNHRPVVVMVPSSLQGKWPRDFAVFRDKCIPKDIANRIQAASAESAVQFLKFLDDQEHRKSILFLTHGAMHRGLGIGSTDSWIKLAIIQRALKGRHNVSDLLRSLYRCLGKLLWLQWVENKREDIWEVLLNKPTEEWLRVLQQGNKPINPDGPNSTSEPDDPVPEAVVEVLKDFDTAEVFKKLQEIPIRQSENYEERVADARTALNKPMKAIWQESLKRLKFKLPLLIMDEAHHLKNPEARLSGLFQNPDAKEDAEEISRGVLGGIFERMLFLTATPFQLGHHELCSVLERFEGISWGSFADPKVAREDFREALRVLRSKLDSAQLAALNLDAIWGSLREQDLMSGQDRYSVVEVDKWWAEISNGQTRSASVQRVLDAYERAREKIREAEASLKPWILRHLKPRTFEGVARREKLPGQAIISDEWNGNDSGIEVRGDALLPFLLAARATACTPESRPVFAEGLASSYEAFLHTRKDKVLAIDEDDDYSACALGSDNVGKWYLERLQETLPIEKGIISEKHPKLDATVRRTIEAWTKGEKVVVFCHYVATGRALRQAISSAIGHEILERGGLKLGCAPAKVGESLERHGKRFFDLDSPLRRACDSEIESVLKPYASLLEHEKVIKDIVRRYLRTPSFLVRFFPLSSDRLDSRDVIKAFEYGDGSGLKLRDILTNFFEHLENRCVENERIELLQAIASIQTGDIRGKEVQGTFAEDEVQGAATELLLPNVRLVNGEVKSETRQRLMLTFNSPFFPEVLIASSVMAEGVDLHRFCRHVIHHDLCWNPSTLEQRTGRLDRIGAKMETARKSIKVYLPYLAATQDEKQYRVVMDRERWFNIVMGEKFKVDSRTAERIAQRIPLPNMAAEELRFQLHCHDFPK